MVAHEKYVIWPIYFDKNASKKKGRKVSRSLAVKHPNVDVIHRAAQKLGLNPKMERKSYPSRWWEKEGCIMVDKKKSKTEILHDLVKVISEKVLC